MVGTHWALAHLGRVKLREPVTRVRFALGVGVLPADLHVGGDAVRRVVMTRDRPAFLETLGGAQVGQVAEGLGLTPGAITGTGLPVQVVSTGVPQMMVPVRSPAQVQTLGAGHLNIAALNRACRAAGTECVLVFALETERTESTVHVRMFAPLLGVPEDPATGRANGALGAYLVHHSGTNAGLRRALPLSEPATPIVVEQGSEMGQSSVLYVEVDGDVGEIDAVRAGGQVVPVAEGSVRF